MGMTGGHLALFTAIMATSLLVCFIELRQTSDGLRHRIEKLESDLAQTNANAVSLNTLVQQLLQQPTLESLSFDASLLQKTVYYDNKESIHRDYFGHMPPSSSALTVIGTEVVHGRIIVEGSIIVNIDGVHVDLGSVVKTLQALVSCTDECLHGIFNASCSCVCFDGWTGTTCEESLCSGRGTWDVGAQTCDCNAGYDSQYYCAVLDCVHGTITPLRGSWVGGVGNPNSSNADIGKCVCDDGYTGTLCDTATIACSTTCKGECDENGYCVCLGTQIGASCQYDCSAAGIQAKNCFFQQTNLGFDQCRYFGDLLICVCGGGYNALTNQIDTRVGSCVECTPEDMALHECCAPDARCVAPMQCNSETCCMSQGEDTCHSSGCSLCEIATGVTTCSLIGNARYNCTVKPNPTVNWDVAAVNCSDLANFAQCSNLMRNRYLSIYNSASSLLFARTLVNSYEWPTLQIASTDYLQTAFTMTASVTPFPCSTSYNIGIGTRFEQTETATLAVTCGNPIVFWIGIGIPDNVTASVGENLLFTDADGRLKCVSGQILNTNLFTSLTMASSSVSPSQIIAIPFSYAFSECANVYMTDNTIWTGDLVLSMDTNNNLIWCNDCAPLLVQTKIGTTT